MSNGRHHHRRRTARKRRMCSEKTRFASGCTFDEIARAIQCSVKEAQALFKEAMR